MRTKVIQIAAGLVVLLIVAIGLASMNANTSSASALASTSGITQAQPLAPTPYSAECGPDWSVVSSPNASMNYTYLSSVAAVSASDVWAVGPSVIEHWDGSTWSVVTSPSVGTLSKVTAVSASDVWAVGQHVSGNVSQTLVEHWNGSAWSIVTSPNVGTYSFLAGVAALSSSDVWAYPDTNDSLIFR